jgi:hypothetical protein
VSGSFVGKREADDDPVAGERIRINATAKKEIGLSIVNGLPRLPNEKCGIESKHARHMKAEPDQKKKKNLLLFSLKPKGKKSYNIQALGASAQCSITASVP